MSEILNNGIAELQNDMNIAGW